MSDTRDTDVNPALTPRGADVVAARVRALKAERDELCAKVAELRARAAGAPAIEATRQADDPGSAADQRELVLLRERCKTLLDSLKSEQARANAAEQRAGQTAREVDIQLGRDRAAADETQRPPRLPEVRQVPPGMPPASSQAPDASGPAWVRARIAALGAARAAAEQRLTALRLHVATSSAARVAEETKVAHLEEELRAVREKLEYVDEERQHLSNEIQRMVDRMHGS